MTQAAHTPGPWELSEYRPPYDDMGGDHSIGYTDADGVFWEIATLEPWRGSRHADARLIAAAPDMLAALEEIESLPVDDYGCREIPPGFLDKARAAIAKARGADNAG